MPLLIPRCRATPLHRCSIQSRSNVMLLLFPSLHLRCPASPLLCSAYHCLTELSMPKHHRTLLCRCYTNFSVADHHETSLCHCYAIPHETLPPPFVTRPCHAITTPRLTLPLPHRTKPRLNCPSLLRCSGCLLLNNAMQFVAGTTPSNAIALLHKAFASPHQTMPLLNSAVPSPLRSILHRKASGHILLVQLSRYLYALSSCGRMCFGLRRLPLPCLLHPSQDGAYFQE